MLRLSGLLTLAVTICGVASQLEVQAEAPRPKIGEAAGELRFKDIRYLPRSLKDFGEQRAYVLVFSNTTCPLAQRYWPKLKRLEAKYRKEGVQFVSVNVGVDDEINEIAQQALDYEVEFPFVKDDGHSCVKGTGAQRTPEVVVLDVEKKIRYRGRIDDQYRLGGGRPEVTSDDLANAIDDLLAGREVRVSETPVDGCLITEPLPLEVKKPITFFENVLPIVQTHCQECHRPGANSPFSLLTLKDVAAQAETIAEVVADRRMPPWHASRTLHFANERGLSAAERETIIAWTKTGKAAGDESKAPPPREFAGGKWEIGEPDLVTTAAVEHKLPAEGFIDYRYTILPYVFLHDTWISDAEILPSNPGVVHHCNMAYVALGQNFDAGNFITGRVPGGTAMKLGEGIAYRIPACSLIALQIHYTTTGKEETNRMSVGFKFPRYVVKQELHHLQVNTSRFEIPPGAPAYPVQSTRTLPFDATGLGMFAHMHLRGKDMTFKALFPDGNSETLLSIPNYHYDWQQNYRWQPGTKKLPKGTKIEVTAHFDNSKFNPFNPDATKTVRHGPQTVQEMMFGFFFYTADGEDLNLKIDPKSGVVVKAKEAANTKSDAKTSAAPAKLDAAFDLVKTAVDKGDVPGAIALVMKDGKVLREEAYGLADVENKRPFAPNTLCWIASITKPVTVAAAMKLVEEGKLGLDDPVEKYLPEFAELKDKDGKHHAVTIRQLMSHTSGIQANPPLRPSFFFAQEFLGRRIEEIATAIAKTQLQFEPGSKAQYSNAAPYVLARVIEVRSGKPFHEQVRETILEPAGMRDSYFIIPATEGQRAAVVYRDTKRDGKDERVDFFRFNPEWKVAMTLPDGGLFSSPREIAKFLQVFLDDNGRVLAKSSVKAMREQQAPGWGLGWALEKSGEESGSFHHSGSSGVTAWADPKTGVVGVLFCQLQNPDKVNPIQTRFRELVREAMVAP